MPLRSQSQCVAHLGLDLEGPDCQPKVTGIQNSDFNSPKWSKILPDTCLVPVDTLALG